MKLTRIATGRVNGPRISGDGSTVVWTQIHDPIARGEVMRNKDGVTKQLTLDFHNDRDARVNHTGDVVTWTHNNGGDNKPGDQDLMRYENGRIQRISSTPNDETQARMTPDGNKIVFQNQGGVDNHWGRIEAWTKEGNEVYTAGINPSMQPVISADGERVAYLRRPAHIRFINDIWLKDQNGDSKPIHENLNRKWSLDMSADGQRLSWIELEGENQSIYLKDLKEGTLEKVHTANRITSCDMSDDGQSFLWGEFDGGDIKLMYSFDRTQPEELFGEIPGRHYQGTISADGEAITWLHEGENGEVAIYKASQE
jgi:Tol biopolymer transport system component